MWSVEKSRTDKCGKRWFFAYWHEGPKDSPVLHPQQLFFWDDEQMECGIVLFPKDKTVRYSLIKSLIEKLVADPELRKQNNRQLRFPVERYYKVKGFRSEEEPSV
jgi:hypothetical protein